MGHRDDFYTGGNDAIDDRERKPPKDKSPSTLRMWWPPFRRLGDGLDCPIDFPDESYCSRFTVLPIPSGGAYQFLGRVGVKDRRKPRHY